MPVRGRFVLHGSLSALLVFLLAACAGRQPTFLNLSFSTHASAPVVITDYRINGHALLMPPTPMLVSGLADVRWPRAGGEMYSLAYPRGGDETHLRMELEWVEVLTARAWHADVVVPLDGLRRSEGGVEAMPIFGADGLLVIASDPIPASAGPEPVNDVVQVCGDRVPDADRDYTVDPGLVIGLADFLRWWSSGEAIRSPVQASPCAASTE